MSDAFWMALFGFATTTVAQCFAWNRSRRVENKVGVVENKVDLTVEKVDHNIELSNSMLSHQVAKKEAAEHKLEQTNAETLAELKAKLAEKETTIGLLTNAPAPGAKESGEVRPFKPEVKEGGLER